ncbi:hypothetical protein [Nitrolancea hollandica]|uniref:Uncharacterized protein n=1 Tax=Nitrolancea hollandica Lb TaxID=1129897 RepID=I4EL01_9BACT|nr:hypothetical protein [Nitrolancea hollandica]CCF85363.1 hypothetical protein NITHO_4880008 [Nitrolancea hollandica Lb]
MGWLGWFSDVERDHYKMAYEQQVKQIQRLEDDLKVEKKAHQLTAQELARLRQSLGLGGPTMGQIWNRQADVRKMVAEVPPDIWEQAKKNVAEREKTNFIELIDQYYGKPFRELSQKADELAKTVADLKADDPRRQLVEVFREVLLSSHPDQVRRERERKEREYRNHACRTCHVDVREGYSSLYAYDDRGWEYLFCHLRCKYDYEKQHGFTFCRWKFAPTSES